MKAGKLAIWPWLVCQYNENMLVNLLSSMGDSNKTTTKTNGIINLEAALPKRCTY